MHQPGVMILLGKVHHLGLKITSLRKTLPERAVLVPLGNGGNTWDTQQWTTTTTKKGNQQSTLVRFLCSAHLSFDLNISIPSVWLECLSKFPEFHSSCPCLNPYDNTSKISLSLISFFLIHPTEDGHYLLKVSSHLVLFLLRHLWHLFISKSRPCLTYLTISQGSSLRYPLIQSNWCPLCSQNLFHIVPHLCSYEWSSQYLDTFSFSFLLLKSLPSFQGPSKNGSLLWSLHPCFWLNKSLLLVCVALCTSYSRFCVSSSPLGHKLLGSSCFVSLLVYLPKRPASQLV